jgi:hypothetical protein
MTENNQDKRDNNDPSSRPNSHAKVVIVKWKCGNAVALINVRSEGKIGARETNGRISKTLVPIWASK